MSLSFCSATELLTRLQAGEISSVEVTSECLRQIDAHDATIHAFVHVARDAALAQAAEIDRRRKSGEAMGPLAGLPVALKDNLCTRDAPTTCGSRMFERFCPPYDATVVTRLHEADAVLIGKTNMDEFAMGSSTETSCWGPTRNPWDPRCVPGGSSGGAAAAVAAGMTPLAVGSDTGGSIRQPASFCGVTGLKPTYGRVSRYGLVALASSMDQVGPIGRSVADVALLLNVLAGHDPSESTSIDAPITDFTDSIRRPLDGLTIGIVREHYDGCLDGDDPSSEGLDAEIEAAVREAVRVYQTLGARVREISLPHSRYAVAAFCILASGEAFANLARCDGIHYGRRADEAAVLADWNAQSRALEARHDQQALDHLEPPLSRLYRASRSEAFGAEVKRRILLGTQVLSEDCYEAYYVKAQRLRRLVRDDFDAAFGEVDVVVGPVAPTAAYPLGRRLHDPLLMYRGDRYTVGSNLAGLAAISVPCGVTAAGLPIGLHLQCPPMQDERLLRAAQMFQQATDWHTRRPPSPGKKL